MHYANFLYELRFLKRPKAVLPFIWFGSSLLSPRATFAFNLLAPLDFH